MESRAVGGREGSTPHSRMQGRGKPELDVCTAMAPGRQPALWHALGLILDHRTVMVEKALLLCEHQEQRPREGGEHLRGDGAC